MSGITGTFDLATDTGIAGWAVYDENPAASLSAKIFIDGAFAGDVIANELRPEVRARGLSSSGRCGWSFTIPIAYCDGEEHEFGVVYACEPNREFRFWQTFKTPNLKFVMHVDHVGTDHVFGWCRDKVDLDRRLTVALKHGDEVVALALASSFRQEVADAGNGDGKFGFKLPVPLGTRFTGAELDIGIVEAQGAFSRLDEVSVARSSVTIVFVTDTTSPSNASRMYRTELQANQLWRAGAEVRVVDRTEVTDTTFNNCDVIVLQRAPTYGAMTNTLNMARQQRTLILYDTDDINTAPDVVTGMGAVRSGFRDPNDPSFAAELAGRMRSAHLSDAIIVPNRFMAKVYQARGFRTIVSPFRIDDRHILHRKISHSGFDWRVLYLSGSPTHRRDFLSIKQSLGAFLDAHKQVFFDVAGHVNEDDFDGLPRTRFFPATEYTEMFARIDQSDCVFVPFERTAFNCGKSATKFMECGARGIPVVASAIPDYSEHVRRSGFGYIAKEDWAAVLETAYHTRGRDFRESEALCKYVSENFSQSHAGNALLDAIIEVYDQVICRGIRKIA